MSALPKPKYTIEQYIELEKSSEERYEYFAGEVFAMAGGSLNHSLIGTNISRAIGNRLSGKPCIALNSDIRVKVPADPPYRYPDATVVCGEPVTENYFGQVMLVNPILLVEVLSPSTKDYDKDEKFIGYQSIESFQEYLLVAQDHPHVTRYVRQADNQWVRSDFIGLDNAVELKSLGVTLPLSEIYQGVQFPTITHERNHLES
jgi:Uma2 family endonuclease